MKKINDQIMLGAISVMLAGIAGRLANVLEYKLGRVLNTYILTLTSRDKSL